MVIDVSWKCSASRMRYFDLIILCSRPCHINPGKIFVQSSVSNNNKDGRRGHNSSGREKWADLFVHLFGSNFF